MPYIPSPTMVTTQKGYYNTEPARRKYFNGKKKKKVSSYNGIPIVKRKKRASN